MDYEGGYTNDPNDPGGETKWGISKRSYPNLIIRELTRDQARDIYRKDFWDKLELDDDEGIIAFQIFDFAVNSGIHVAIRYLQRALGIADDGWWGPISRAAFHDASTDHLVMQLISQRLDYMTRLSGWDRYGRGWARRIAQNLRYGAT